MVRNQHFASCYESDRNRILDPVSGHHSCLGKLNQVVVRTGLLPAWIPSLAREGTQRAVSASCDLVNAAKGVSESVSARELCSLGIW